MDRATTAAPCDCCGSMDWAYLLGADGYHLGRCRSCGLLYVGDRPSAAQRLNELDQGVFGEGRRTNEARRHLREEQVRRQRYGRLVALAEKLAPPGRWLDIGCGTGTLLRVAEEQRMAIDGIELSPARRDLAREHTSAQIFERPLEDLHLPDASYAAAFMVNVFSHLFSPSATFAEIRRILVPGGIVVIWTTEFGAGVKARHMWDWGLGDHLQFLGDETIERYADRFGFELVRRERAWLPDVLYSPERLAAPGTSRIRNALKHLVLTVPGAFPLFRAIMTARQRDNPVHVSLLALRRRGSHSEVPEKLGQRHRTLSDAGAAGLPDIDRADRP
jgi:SAM-dependent methyltransferase